VNKAITAKLQRGNQDIATQKLIMPKPMMKWAILLLVRTTRGPRKSMRKIEVHRSWAAKTGIPS